tara:strand:+ start:7030 stop:7701 length:672 start_codon:yes stop_codon:yes gene_type:complete
MAAKKESYKVISLVDVNELLSFAKKEYKDIEQQIKEEQRVEKELKTFIKNIEGISGNNIQYIGHEKRFGSHLVRFLFKQGGFLEVMVEKPLTMNAHFIDTKTANKFLKGLKKSLRKTLPDSNVKKMFIDSLSIQEGVPENIVSMGEWGKMHKIAIHKTFVFTIVAGFLLLIIELIKTIFHEFTREYIGISSFIITFITALLIAIFFEKIKFQVEKLSKKIFKI